MNRQQPSKNLLRTLRHLLVITAGSFIYAFAFNWLFVPNHIVMGGFTGLAQTLHRFVPLCPVGVTIIVLNLPLFALGIRRQGFRLLFSSVYAMAVSSLFIDILACTVDFPPMEDHLVACVFGGGLVGASMGMILLVGATTGGTELAARLLKYHYRHISIGKICLLIDLCVVALYTIAYPSIDDALYAVIAMYISSIAMDTVIYGRNTSKVACIICADGQAMREKLIGLDLGVTNLRAQGGFSNENRDVLLCAFKPSKIGELKAIVAQTDQTAFVIICNAEDVFGEGFADFSLDSL